MLESMTVVKPPAVTIFVAPGALIRPAESWSLAASIMTTDPGFPAENWFDSNTRFFSPVVVVVPGLLELPPHPANVNIRIKRLNAAIRAHFIARISLWMRIIMDLIRIKR
jgi:hypothetical protein